MTDLGPHGMTLPPTGDYLPGLDEHEGAATGFRALNIIDDSSAIGGEWVVAEVLPGLDTGCWHVSVFKQDGTATVHRPVAHECVGFLLRRSGVLKADFRAVHAKPTRNNRWGPPPATDRPADVRDVYFIQGIDGGPIKIGVAGHPEIRMAEIQLMSPARLRILGTIRGVGQPEEHRLHRRFAAHRIHGEWFLPVPEITDYIRENA